MLREGIDAGRLALQPVAAGFVRETQAAGFRQRREGLAYRPCWRKAGVRPRKRGRPGSAGLPWRRRMNYRLRHAISRGRGTVFRLAGGIGRAHVWTTVTNAPLV